MFILDESNMLESSFLERMNTLLANGEVSAKHLFGGSSYPIPGKQTTEHIFSFIDQKCEVLFNIQAGF